MTSKYQQHNIQDHSINVGTTTIHASKSARNLGIVFDDNLCMDQHVKRGCQSVYFHIRNVSGIRKILTDETAATIIHALITSRIDNSNSLLTGITDRGIIRKLQLAQNAAARILTKTSKFDHITPILKDLHWLPIRERIDFKILILTWKALNGNAPEYLSNLLIPYIRNRTLRSSDKQLLVVPRASSAFGDRGFSVAAPTLWNFLPLNIRNCDSFQTFKNLLKTYLYNKAYTKITVFQCVIDHSHVCILMFYCTFVVLVCASE